MISRTGNLPPQGIAGAPRAVTVTPSHEVALRLFKLGHDTVDIAKWIGADEARAVKLLHEAREAKRAAG